jgi:CubicO group peptidase (beta-lactamase class C family)
MLSWSMAKSVLAALVGIAVGDGRLALDAAAPVPEWSSPADPRRAITLDHLLRMSSGLRFDETYGATNDVSRMLFTAPDTGAFAARSPLAAPPGSRWAYSSGTSNLLARVLRGAVGGDLEALLRFARERLFDPVGMTSAFFEPDASGTFIGSSFAFATARDWARFGELHRRGGEWYGRRVLPEGWVAYETTPAPSAPPRCYGAHWWLNAAADAPGCRPWRGVPADAYAARGHSGQYVVVVPSARLVVVRLGLSLPDDGDDGGAELVAELASALAGAPDPD